MNPMHSFIKGSYLPPKWKRTCLGEVGKISSGATPSRSSLATLFGGGIPWVKTGDLNNSRIRVTEECLSEEGLNSCSCHVHPAGQTVLVAMYGGFRQIGRTGLLTTKAATNQAISAIVCNPEVIDPAYLLHWLNGYRFLWKEFAGSSRKDPNITKQDVISFPVAFPPLPEQHRVGNILTAWDDALENLDLLIDTKRNAKKAIMQRLLNGKKRMKGFTAKWQTARLGDLAENIAQQNKGRFETNSLYAVTKNDGIVPMREHVKGKSFERCKIVEPDWFAYNPMRINIGSIARWQGEHTIMVSGDYVVFRTNPKKLSPAFLDHVRHTWRWQHFVTFSGNGSVRIRIYFDDLGAFTFSCPPIDEQRAIANVLDTCDAELQLLQKQREAIGLQKRGLMQRLLTGKIRINTN